MSKPAYRVLMPLCLYALALCTTQASAAPDTGAGTPLVVGTKLAPPFVMKAADGDGYTGISIDLWEAVAHDLGLTYRYEPRSLDGLFSGLEDGSLDISVAALTTTAAREKRVDFAYPFFTTGLAIAVTEGGDSIWAALSGFFSWQFFTAVMTLVALLLVAGTLVWIFEHRRNPQEFGGRPTRGLAEGFWWAAVTMTTVGYGDRAPRTLGGRIIGLIWMIAAMIVASSLTAAIATSLTVNKLQTGIDGVDDLAGARVASVHHSAATEVLSSRGVGHATYPSLGAALDALEQGQADAVVYDAPILRHAILQRNSASIKILNPVFERQDYAFALPTGSRLQEQLDQAILAYLKTPEWTALLTRYLGAR